MSGFSAVPLQAFSLIGTVVAFGGIVFGMFLFVRRLVVGAEVEGVFTLFAILFTVLGIAMLSIGILGEYIAPDLPAGAGPAAIPRAPGLRPGGKSGRARPKGSVAA